jgi:hypothetical protein
LGGVDIHEDEVRPWPEAGGMANAPLSLTGGRPLKPPNNETTKPRQPRAQAPSKQRVLNARGVSNKRGDHGKKRLAIQERLTNPP